MGRPRADADERRVRVPLLAAILVGLVPVAALTGTSTPASAGGACIDDRRTDGYSYAGHQDADRGHGVRATITLTRAPEVEAGHVAGWVGVGGPGQGRKGEDSWIQGGIAATPGAQPFLYAEVTRDGRPELIVLGKDVRTGRSHEISVLEIANRPGWWRVWIDDRVVTDPIRVDGSTGRWAPIATAENWSAGTSRCNSFGFRFERVSVSRGRGGSWRGFVPGHRFLSGSNKLRDLTGGGAEASAETRTPARTPFAFVATSD